MTDKKFVTEDMMISQRPAEVEDRLFPGTDVSRSSRRTFAR